MQNNFNKRQREKKKREKKNKKLESRIQKNKERKELREDGTTLGELSNMIARVDHNGVIIPTEEVDMDALSEELKNEDDDESLTP